MAMAHRHAHVDPGADRGRRRVALALVLALMAGEVAAGLIAGSLALLSDAGHMLTDAAAIGFPLGGRPPAPPPPGRPLHLRAPASRDPVGPAQRGDARGAGGGDRLRGHPQ